MTTPYSLLHTVRSTLTPVLRESRFLETGVLTPEEFVRAGDSLVSRCGTWSWQGGQSQKRAGYLPAEKQYLAAHHVPSARRVRDIYSTQRETDCDVGADTDRWVAVDDTRLDAARRTDAPAMDADEDDHAVPPRPADMDDIPTMEFDEDEDDAAAAAADVLLFRPGGASGGPAAPAQSVPSGGGTVRTRTYSVFITYDKAYQVPRFWMLGYDEAGQPLSPAEIFEDISEQHALKTVTIEPFPHEPWVGASIHPCKHASVMQTLLQRQAGASADAPLQVETYLFVFLKFMSSVVPTVEYDFTA